MKTAAHASVLALALAAPALWGQLIPGSPLAGLEKLKPFETMRASSSNPNWKNGNSDVRPIPPGGTLATTEPIASSSTGRRSPRSTCAMPGSRPRRTTWARESSPRASTRCGSNAPAKPRSRKAISLVSTRSWPAERLRVLVRCE
ncbi:MAG TPA: hypothetical protein P5555_09735 [Candidatus Paceibacterota bacterium]|nr:hypothetical protein [Verrucomicrobiota bacterium]HRZ45457.1 hypothetical protein [Candidatus Paceibacterota bacterium]HRZ92896.1 hypothetical protein [Candidatus Paceibacterota bacterium]